MKDGSAHSSLLPLKYPLSVGRISAQEAQCIDPTNGKCINALADIKFRGFFIVPLVGRSDAQRFGAPILPTHHKRPSKILFADLILLKGSYFFYVDSSETEIYQS